MNGVGTKHQRKLSDVTESNRNRHDSDSDNEIVIYALESHLMSSLLSVPMSSSILSPDKVLFVSGDTFTSSPDIVVWVSVGVSGVTNIRSSKVLY